MLGRTPRLLLAVSLVAAAAASACEDTTGLRAQFNNREVQLAVFPVNGTSQTLPAGILIRAPELARVDSRWAFDIAFDMDDAGNVTVYTVRAMGSEVLPGLSRVGLQTDTNPYAAIARAPGGGFTYDSLVTLPVGRTLLIDKLDGTCAQFGGGFLGYNIKAKMVIDSVNLSSRAIFVKMLSNPNCGFRSLQTGLPKD
jgi:hypothetical protein